MIHKEDKAENARLAAERDQRKRDMPVKPCINCYMIWPSATKTCHACGHAFYHERKRKNEDIDLHPTGLRVAYGLRQ